MCVCVCVCVCVKRIPYKIHYKYSITCVCFDMTMIAFYF